MAVALIRHQAVVQRLVQQFGVGALAVRVIEHGTVALAAVVSEVGYMRIVCNSNR